MNKRAIVYVLGAVLLIGAALMLPPLLVALIYHEVSGWYFLWVMLGAAVLGALALRLGGGKRAVMYAKEGLIAVALSWIVLSLVGALPFTLSGQIPLYLDAVFEMISGFTTTGSSILPAVEELDKCMLFWRSFSHWIGGMGILVFMLAIVRMDGGQAIHLLRAESPGPTVSKMVPRMADSSKILYGIYFGLTVLQILFYLAGGEPLLAPELPELLSKLRAMGFAVKLDTNGTHPAALRAVLEAGLVDYVAMDIKNSPDKYAATCGRDGVLPAVRESAEDVMRDEELDQTTVTTATLELGIDIGRLERAFQIDAPFTVSAFLQRMGRTGRRGSPPEMWFVMREDRAEPRTTLGATIPWKLLQGIALVQLYLEDRWVEPPRLDRLPYSLLYHQTMATLASGGEMTPAELAARVLTLGYFHRVSSEDFRILLHHLIDIDHIQLTEEGGLIVGIAGERVINSYRFYGVFQENEEYTVRNESQELGTIVLPPPVGEKLAIAGATWLVEEVDHKRHLVYATQVKGQVPAYFGDCPGDINTVVLERMLRVLMEDADYPYLMDNARGRLAQARSTARNAHLDHIPLVRLGGDTWGLFPWLGSYAFLALERFLKIKCADQLQLKGLDSSRPYFMEFRMKGDEQLFYDVLAEQATTPFDPLDLVYPDEVPIWEKYDEYVPIELIRKGFAESVLDIDGMLKRVRQWCGLPDEEPPQLPR